MGAGVSCIIGHQDLLRPARLKAGACGSAPPLPFRTRHHLAQGAILQPVMVVERCQGMQQHQRDQRHGEDVVQQEDRPGGLEAAPRWAVSADRPEQIDRRTAGRGRGPTGERNQE